MTHGSTPQSPRQAKGRHRASRSAWKQWFRKWTGRGEEFTFLSVDRGVFVEVAR